jgi:single-strand DNA-binding protein
MASVNRVILIGNLGRDPEIRYTQGGEPIANFSLATSEKWTGKDGQKQERTEWHRVEVFGKTAQVVRDYCSKGKQVYLEGSIHYDEWTDKDGNKRNTTKIRVSGPQSRLVLLGSRGEGGAPGGGGPGGGGPGGGGGRGAAEKEPGGGPPADDFQVSDDDVPF